MAKKTPDREGRRGFLKGLGALVGGTAMATAAGANEGLREALEGTIKPEDRTRKCVCGAPLVDCNVQESGYHAGGAMLPPDGLAPAGTDIERPPDDLVLWTRWSSIQVRRDEAMREWVLSGKTDWVEVPPSGIGRALVPVLNGCVLPSQRADGKARGYSFINRRHGDGKTWARLKLSDYRIADEEIQESPVVVTRVDGPRVGLWPEGTQHLNYAITHGHLDKPISVKNARPGQLVDVPAKEFEKACLEGTLENHERVKQEGLVAMLANAAREDRSVLRGLNKELVAKVNKELERA